MTSKLITTIGILTMLFAVSAVAQQKQEKHLEADKALAKFIDLEQDFGEKLKFHSREVVTMAVNDKVPGLNGLMFMRWKGDAPNHAVLASVQWFEKKEDLLKFYASSTKQEIYKLGAFEGTSVWKINEDGGGGYSWTDGEHILVSLGGAPSPPPEMVKAWLAMIDSKVADIEKKREKEQMPADSPKK